MRKELDEKLCADYPEIFKDRHGDMRQTCMVWGFDVGDGWYSLLDTLCGMLSGEVRSFRKRIEHISEMLKQEDKSSWSEWARGYYNQELLDRLNAQLEEAVKKIPVAVQVKEKFGTLRFYVNGAADEQYNYISFAEAMSGRVCETCGTTKDVFQTSGWIKTTCKACSAEEWEEYNNDEADEVLV